MARIAPAILGLAAFAGIARMLDPALYEERAGALRPAEEAEIRATLGRFWKIYEDFFASGGGPAMLDAFPASKAVKHFVFRDIGFLDDAGLVSVQDLASASVVAIGKKRGGVVEADVYEEWNHVLQSREGRKPRTRVKGLGQGFRYVLRREGSGWVVVGWDIIDAPAPPRKEGMTW